MILNLGLCYVCLSERVIIVALIHGSLQYVYLFVGFRFSFQIDFIIHAAAAVNMVYPYQVQFASFM